MRRSIVAALALVLTSTALSAKADVIISLTATDAAGNPLAQPVAPGSTAIVEIALAVDEADDPLADIRAIQLDFSATDSAIELDEFTWFVDSAGYVVQLNGLPRPGVATSSSNSSPSLITLTTEALVVAEVLVTVTGEGQLDLGFSPEQASTPMGAVQAGFDAPMDFTAANDNVVGGTFAFIVGTVVVDGDGDGDGVPDDEDAFPADPTETVDTDGDGTGDNADTDDDNDGVDDVDDDFPLDPAEAVDSDGDGVGDNGDAFPEDADEQVDTDDDGIGDNQDTDDDGDGVDDSVDAFPLDPDESADSDGDGIGDNAEADQNTGTRVSGGPCGIGMIATMLFVLMGLVGQRRRLRQHAARRRNLC